MALKNNLKKFLDQKRKSGLVDLPITPTLTELRASKAAAISRARR
jgi:hypothetical protein